MTPEEFKDKFIDEDNEVDLPDTDVVSYDEEVEGKYVSSTNVYKHGDQFFAVTFVRTNTSYWCDSEVTDVTVGEVFPYTFTETRYK